ASMSRVEGSTGTTTASATSSQVARPSAIAPAAPSITTRSASPGTVFQVDFWRRLPSSASTALSIGERRPAQRIDEPCGSASMSTVLWPDSAAFAARCVAIVVLPTPPLELATRTVFMRSPPVGQVRRGYTGRAGAASGGVCYLHAPVPPPVRLMSELQDLAALIRAGTPLIVVETPDEPRVVEMFRQTLTRVWRAMYRWTITEGLRRIDLDSEDPAELSADVGTTLRAIRGADQRGVYLLLDFHPYLEYGGSQRQVRDILQRRDCLPHTLVLVGHKVELPPGLEAKAVRYRPRLPDAAALRRLV